MSAPLLLTAAILGVIVLHALWCGWRRNRARRSISVARGAVAVPRIDPGWEAVGTAIWPTRSTVSRALRGRLALRVLLSLVAGRRGLLERLKSGAGRLNRPAAILPRRRRGHPGGRGAGALPLHQYRFRRRTQRTRPGHLRGAGGRRPEPGPRAGWHVRDRCAWLPRPVQPGRHRRGRLQNLFPGTDQVTETVIGGHAVAIIGLAVVLTIVLGGS